MLYQLGFIYRRPTCSNYCSILCSQRAADFNPRAISLFNPNLIHFGSDLPRALYSGADAVCQKRFFGKNRCVVLLQRWTAQIEKSTKLVSHENLRLRYTVITQPVQDTVVLNRRTSVFTRFACFRAHNKL